MDRLGIGIIGTGNISGIYLDNARRFAALDLIACADINVEAAQAKAEAHGIEALSVEDLLADPRIGLVLNLTTPAHHVPVGLQVLAAGKHLYAEKPLATGLADGRRLVAAAETAGLRIGSAPDTFLGGAHQRARDLVDHGAIGRVLAGSAHMMVPGHELWHPNPDFYYQPGGGPMFDMGPYYLTCLINMLGPVAALTGAVSRGHATRTIASGPRAGQVIAVEVPTHVTGILDFTSGAQVTLTTSFDVWKHNASHIELYGTEGAMVVPDPNHFEGEVRAARGRGDWGPQAPIGAYGAGNWRILGLADMAEAILTGRPHRANSGVALHVLEIMETIHLSAAAGRRMELTTTTERPAPLTEALRMA